MRDVRRHLHTIIKLHHDLNWSEIAREALRKKMAAKGLLREVVADRTLTVREAIRIDEAVKTGILPEIARAGDWQAVRIDRTVKNVVRKKAEALRVLLLKARHRTLYGRLVKSPQQP